MTTINLPSQPFGCIRNTIRLSSGRYFDFLDPQPDQFMLTDIAAGLSKICRFGGQIPHFYSVAEHSVHCAQQAKADGHGVAIQLACLLHDAAEAFTGDVVKPLKLLLPDFAAVELRVEQAVAAKFGIDFETNKGVVKEIDNAMLIAERSHWFGPDGPKWPGEHQMRKLDVRLLGWRPQIASQRFMNLAAELGIHG